MWGNIHGWTFGLPRVSRAGAVTRGGSSSASGSTFCPSHLPGGTLPGFLIHLHSSLPTTPVCLHMCLASATAQGAQVFCRRLGTLPGCGDSCCHLGTHFVLGLLPPPLAPEHPAGVSSLFWSLVCRWLSLWSRRALSCPARFLQPLRPSVGADCQSPLLCSPVPT